MRRTLPGRSLKTSARLAIIPLLHHLHSSSAGLCTPLSDFPLRTLSVSPFGPRSVSALGTTRRYHSSDATGSSSTVPPMPSREALRRALDHLGLSTECTDQDIKVAFQTLMKLHHPDVATSDPAAAETEVEVHDITVAYQLLRRTNSEVRAAILAGRSPAPSSFAGQSDFQYSAEEYERAMKMYKGSSRRPRSATPVDGRTAAFNNKMRDLNNNNNNTASNAKTPNASTTAAGEDGGEYALNPAPWINQRHHEAIFKTNEASLLKRYWVLCGLPVLFLFVAWMIWWWVYWRLCHPYFFPNATKSNNNSNNAESTAKKAAPPSSSAVIEARPPMSPPRLPMKASEE